MNRGLLLLVSLAVFAVAFSTISANVSAQSFSLQDLINYLISVFTGQPASTSSQGRIVGEGGEIRERTTTTTTTITSVCTADAKVCPDGSYVGRDPYNNCEFRPCPSGTTTTTTTSFDCFYRCPDGTVVHCGASCPTTTTTTTTTTTICKCPDGYVQQGNNCISGPCYTLPCGSLAPISIISCPTTTTTTTTTTQTTRICPQYIPPYCPDGTLIGGGIGTNGCPFPSTCCGNDICSGQENYSNCPKDCTTTTTTSTTTTTTATVTCSCPSGYTKYGNVCAPNC